MRRRPSYRGPASFSVNHVPAAYRTAKDDPAARRHRLLGKGHYCYAFPFAVGAHLAGHPQHVVDAVSAVLLRIDTASQLVDDITGAFPGVVDHKDTPEEVGRLLAAALPLTVRQARDLRAALWGGPVPGTALRLCDALVEEISPQLAVLPVGAATRAYLDDLIRHRLVASLERLRASVVRR